MTRCNCIGGAWLGEGVARAVFEAEASDFGVDEGGECGRYCLVYGVVNGVGQELMVLVGEAERQAERKNVHGHRAVEVETTVGVGDSIEEVERGEGLDFELYCAAERDVGFGFASTGAVLIVGRTVARAFGSIDRRRVGIEAAGVSEESTDVESGGAERDFSSHERHKSEN